MSENITVIEEYRQCVSVAGCLMRDGQVLVLRRPPDEETLPGFYQLPGGKVDFGENPVDALRREFQEETGLAVLVQEIANFCDFLSADETIHYVTLVFLVKLQDEGTARGIKPAVKLSREHDDHQWLTAEEALNHFYILPAIKRVIWTAFLRHPQAK